MTGLPDPVADPAGYVLAMSGPGCEACRVVGPLLVGPGTSGRAWHCEYGRVWTRESVAR